MPTFSNILSSGEIGLGAPTITISNPTILVDGTTVTVTADSDTGGGRLYVVLTGSTTAPSADNIKAGLNANGGPPEKFTSRPVNNPKTSSITFLNVDDGRWTAHFVQQDDASNVYSNIISSVPADVGDPPAVLTAPTISVSDADITVGATTDVGAGTLFAVLTTDATAPTASQVENGLNSAGAAAKKVGSLALASDGAKTIALNANANGTYYAHLCQRTAGGLSNVVTTTAATVTNGVVAFAAFAGFSAPAQTMNPGQQVTVNDTSTINDSNDTVFQYTLDFTSSIGSGVIWEFGATGDGAAASITTTGQMRVLGGKGGNSNAATSTQTVAVFMDVSGFVGRRVRFYNAIKARAPGRIKVYAYDEDTGELLATAADSITDGSKMGSQDSEGDYTGSNSGGFMRVNGLRGGMGVSNVYNGTAVGSMQAYQNQLPTDFTS